MVGFVEKNDQKPPTPETNSASSFSSNSPPVVPDVDNNSQPLRVKIYLQGHEIVVSSDDKPPLGLKLEKKQPFLNKIAATATAEMPVIAHHSVNSIVRQRLIEAQPHPYQLQFQPPQYHHYHQQQPPMPDKLKASNFAAMFIKIGSWQRTAMNEGELVAKFYYAKKRIVWEVLDGALKSKIEMQWSDIEGIKATIFHDDLRAPGVLELELNQPPQFLREKNPLPRTHTLWKQTEDFTEGQAPMCRRHLIKFPGGVLNKPYEKLLQCDPRLLELSRRPFPRMESPYFYPESTFNVTTCNDGILFNAEPAGEAHSSYSHMLQQYFSPLSSSAPAPSSFLVSPPHQLVQNPNLVHSLLDSNPPRLPLLGNFQAPLDVAAGFPPLLDGQMAVAYENLVNDNRYWHRGTPSIIENSNIFYSRGQDQIQRLPPFPNPSAAAPQAFPGSPTATTNYNVAALNTENTSDDIRRLLQWDSRPLSLPRPMMSSSTEPFTAEINALGNSGLMNAQLQLQQQLYKPKELLHGENFRADGGLLCPQPLHSFPPHSFEEENAMTPPHSFEEENAMTPHTDDDDDTDYALSYGGYGTQPQQ